VAPCAKAEKNGGEKDGCFCNWYKEVALLCNLKIGIKFGKKSIGVLC